MEGEPTINSEDTGLEKASTDGKGESATSAEVDLTPEQKENIQIMDGVKEKYPLAFESVSDKKGRETLIVKNPDPTPAFLIFTREGVFGVARADRRPMWQGMDFTPLLDLAEKLGPKFGVDVGKKGLEEQISGGEIKAAWRIDLHVDNRRQWMSGKLQESQEYWEERLQKSRSLTPEEIISQL